MTIFLTAFRMRRKVIDHLPEGAGPHAGNVVSAVLEKAESDAVLARIDHVYRLGRGRDAVLGRFWGLGFTISSCDDAAISLVGTPMATQTPPVMATSNSPT